MKDFVGCLILIGIHHLPTLCNFWSSDPLLKVDAIIDVMTSKSFKKLLENIHCIIMKIESLEIMQNMINCIN